MKRPCIDGVYFISNTVGIHLDQLPEVRSAYTSRRPDFTSSYPGLQYVRTPYLQETPPKQGGLFPGILKLASRQARDRRDWTGEVIADAIDLACQSPRPGP